MHCVSVDLYSSLHSARTIITLGHVTMSCPGLFPHLPMRALAMTSEVMGGTLKVDKASGPALGSEVEPDPDQNLDGVGMG